VNQCCGWGVHYTYSVHTKWRLWQLIEVKQWRRGRRLFKGRKHHIAYHPYQAKPLPIIIIINMKPVFSFSKTIACKKGNRRWVLCVCVSKGRNSTQNTKHHPRINIDIMGYLYNSVHFYKRYAVYDGQL
jgi:hypothetical protein